MTTTLKTCFKCNNHLPLSEFYKHKQMADGHLNKCKSCAKKDVANHREENLDKIREYDRMRYRRDEYRQEQLRNLYKSMSPTKRKVHYLVSNAIRDGRLERPDGCWHCGTICTPEAHHAYYDVERFKDVTWLCRSCHIKVHS